MFKVPFYRLEDYQEVLGKNYEEQNTEYWLNFFDLIAILDKFFVEKYADLTMENVSDYFFDGKNEFWQVGKFKGRLVREVVLAIKLLMPTIWNCSENLWDVGNGSHTGIDLFLPKGTPIMSFSNGEVYRVKNWDENSEDEGNCVVVKSGKNIWSYHHLDEISVSHGQLVSTADQIGTCGDSGSNKGVHLHLQVDNENAAFNPYRSNSVQSVKKNTDDPLKFLRKFVGVQMPFWDMPDELHYQQAVMGLYRLGILAVENKKLDLNKTVSRWEFAVLIYNLAKKKDLFRKLPIVHHESLPFVDMESVDEDQKNILSELQKYGIMVGYQNKFFPHEAIKTEECLSILGRILFHLQDSDEEGKQWYDSYIEFFVRKNVLDVNSNLIGKSLLKKDLLELVWKVLKI